jgi:hypothetical protein
MLKAANREQERSLDLESIGKFPCTDLRTIDQLWVKYSNGRFGFSVQKRIWESVGGRFNYDYEMYCKFGVRVGWRIEIKLLGLKASWIGSEWVSYERITFDLWGAPQGHLPVSAIGHGRYCGHQWSEILSARKNYFL